MLQYVGDAGHAADFEEFARALAQSEGKVLDHGQVQHTLLEADALRLEESYDSLNDGQAFFKRYGDVNDVVIKEIDRGKFSFLKILRGPIGEIRVLHRYQYTIGREAARLQI